jgi:proteasome lid subunit RPN8/RPN11
MQAVTLPRPLAAELAQLAEAAYPQEACALLVGRQAAVTRIVPAANVAAEPRRNFEVDPTTQIRLRRQLRETPNGEILLGHWHSHPEGRAEPSATDAAMAFEPELVWLISAVHGGKAGAPAAFLPQPGGGFLPLMLQII